MKNKEMEAKQMLEGARLGIQAVQGRDKVDQQDKQRMHDAVKTAHQQVHQREMSMQKQPARKEKSKPQEE